MNWLDMILFCLAGAGFAKGLFDGVIKQVVSLVTLFAAIFLCGKLVEWGKILMLSIGWFPEHGLTVVSYLMGFLLVSVVLGAAGFIVHRMVAITPLDLVNHLMGGLLGLLVSVLFLSLVLNTGEQLDPNGHLLKEKTREESNLYKPIHAIVPTIYPGSLFIKEKQK